jgi:hypothetical protein
VKKFKWMAEKNVVREGGLWVFKSGRQIKIADSNNGVGENFMYCTDDCCFKIDLCNFW